MPIARIRGGKVTTYTVRMPISREHSNDIMIGLVRARDRLYDFEGCDNEMKLRVYFYLIRMMRHVSIEKSKNKLSLLGHSPANVWYGFFVYFN